MNEQKMSAGQAFVQNQGLVHLVTRKISGRVKSCNIPMEYEDIFQELSMVFINAWDKFDKDRGQKFSTYFTSSAYYTMNRMINKESKMYIELGLISLDQDATIDGDDGGGFGDSIPCPSLTPEEKAICDNLFDRHYKSMSKNAKKVLEWFINPPDYLLKEIDMRNEKAKLGRSLGKASKTVSFSTSCVLSVFCKSAGLTQVQHYKIHKEIAPLMELI